MPRLPKRRDSSEAAASAAATSCNERIRCRGDLLVFTHLLCGVAVFLACYRWQDLLPNLNVDWISSKDSNSTAITMEEPSGVLDFAAPPLFPKGTVENIYYMHVQKTGGSFFNTIFFEFCPEALPKERQDAMKKWGKAIDEGHLSDIYLVNAYPPKQWCGGVSFYNMPEPGYHHPYKERPGEEFFSMTMFRHPIERLWSAYRFGRHGSWVKDPSQTTFAEFVREPNIPNCQLKMVLGYQCSRQLAEDIAKMPPLDVDLAIARVSDSRFFFGLTERWAESICLFHRWFGGNVIPDIEFFNTRKGSTVAPGNYHNEVPMHEELKWYEAILPVFEERLKAANCLGYEPPEDENA